MGVNSDQLGLLQDEAEQLTKLQKSVLSWLKKNVPVKKTKFSHSHVVQYFSAGKALDALMKVGQITSRVISISYQE